MPARTNRDVVDRYADAMRAGDMDARGALLSDDFVEVYPQSGERFRGPENARAVIERYPDRDSMSPPAVDELIGVEDRWVVTPSFTALKVAGGGEAYTVVGRITYANGEEWHMVQLLRVSDGFIRHMTTYFAPAFDPPEWRAPYREAE